jgi:outer membrane protein OmpA-like peptidoglycan-associated protein
MNYTWKIMFPFALVCPLISIAVSAQESERPQTMYNELAGDALIWARIDRNAVSMVLEKKLKSTGVTSFQQLAAWTNADISKFSKILNRDVRTLENWRAAAKNLAAATAQNCIAGLKLIAKNGIHHDFGALQPRLQDQPLVDRIGGALVTCSFMPSLRIEGHTDGQGDEELNRELSSRRAEFVRDQLVLAGIDAEKLKTFGLANQRPAIVKPTDANRWQNRRVEICLSSDPRPCPLPGIQP